MTDNDFWGEPISVYLVAEAVADGTMRRVDEAVSREAGFKIPVTITQGAWATLVAWDGDAAQDEAGRLWDVLWVARVAAARARPSDSMVTFTVLVVPEGGTRPRPVEVWAVVQAYDRSGAPCMTIHLPEER